MLQNVAVLLGAASGVLAAIGPVTDLTIANKVIAPDGVPRDTVLAGGTFPGPLIQGRKGDRFRINVVDQLQNETMLTATSVHWHGLFQHSTNWADGTAFVTQCPITKDHSFQYDFRVPDQAGTFWYHSHLATQYCDGLRGPMVVYDPHDPHAHLYDVDNEDTVITLADWYHLAAAVVQGERPPSPNSVLINGLGRWLGNPTSELAVINVEHGKRYRFRVISMSCDPFFTFSIDNHALTIIEADGENTQPHSVDSLAIFSAQRYSLVVTANQTIGNYWIRANPNNNEATGFANGINSAILRYKGAPEQEPSSTQTSNLRTLVETDLQPLTNPAAPGKPYSGGVDYALHLTLGFNAPNFTINGHTFNPPSVPVLLQILSGKQSAQSLLPAGSVYTLPPYSTIELSFNASNVVGDPHPFHLHGHTFSVVRSANSSEYNYKNPVRRDVVSTGAGNDNVTIRFVTDNPGPWLLHCHIDWHLQAGLAVVFAEDTKDTAFTNPLPESWKDLCPTYNQSLHSP
ncbi:transporter [Ganoderma sinense ZZ0214-1]|uniref:laccase n=1 Tax=Ganoderma sinense ZZ0214-1 TaxID=1077348 RepID=A0A2G8S990_9APHY|nr:transporter [Ganoderma sinense ZZ0214-1]